MMKFLNYVLAAAMLFAAPAFAATMVNQQTVDKYVADTQKVVNTWLAVADQGNYGESWDQASSLLKKTMPKNEWITVMNTLRKPLGSVKSRKIIDIGTSENPKNLPPGEYMVYYYNTAFANKDNGQELITLELGNDNVWRVMTYQVLTAPAK
jgi:hypothetical protein